MLWSLSVFLFTRLAFSQIQPPRTIEVRIPGLDDGPVILDPARQAELSNSPQWLRFINAHRSQYAVRWNELTEVPHRIVGKGLPLPTFTSMEQAARTFLFAQSQLLKLNPAELVFDHISQRNPKSLKHTWFKQEVGGIPVYKGSAKLTVNQRNEAIQFGSDFYPDINVSLTPGLSEDDALQLAKDAVNFDAAHG